ncbi:hypothetical protein ABKV19_004280, partial [Rosa sericea]
ELCETNKLSRAQGGAPHRTGLKSFARIRKEMMDRGEKTDRLTMFMKTRAKKTKNNEGQQVETFDEEAAAIISQFNDYLEERLADEEDDSYREEVFTKVMGEDTHGRVRMYGTGVTPSQIFGQTSTTSEINEKRTLEDMERNYESKLNDLKNGYESQLGEMKSKYDDVSSRLDLLMAHVGIQVNSSGTRSDQ